MKYANYVGRVGALAVALGVGAAVATYPGTVFAQEGAASDSPSASDATSSPPSDSEPQSSEPSASVQATTAPTDGGATAVTDGSTPTVATDSEPADQNPDSDLVGSTETVTEPTATPTPDPAPSDTSASATASSPPNDHPVDTSPQTGSSTATPNLDSADAQTPADDGAAAFASVSSADVPDAATTSSSRTPATFSTAVVQDAPTTTEPADSPFTALLAVPAQIINAAVDVVVGILQPLVGPGGPFENAALFAALAWTRNEFTRAFANRRPEIGFDTTSLVVDENSTDNSIGQLPATDADGDTLTYRIDPDGQPAHGTVDIDGNVVTYTPDAGYTGADTFTLTASDANAGAHFHAPGQGHTDSARVDVTVQGIAPPTNAAPVSVNDSYSTTAGQALTVTADDGVLSNDTDADGDGLTAAVVGTPEHGTLDLHGDGSFTYTPNANYSGPDAFSYRANDGTVDGNTATVNLTVNPAPPTNAAPVSVNDSYSTTAGQALTVTADDGVLSNDTDADGDGLTAAVVGTPEHGTLDLHGDGSFTYTPNANYSGPDAFSYRANDGTVDGNTATVNLTVNPGVDAIDGKAVVNPIVGTTGYVYQVVQAPDESLFVRAYTADGAKIGDSAPLDLGQHPIALLDEPVTRPDGSIAILSDDPFTAEKIVTIVNTDGTDVSSTELRYANADVLREVNGVSYLEVVDGDQLDFVPLAAPLTAGELPAYQGFNAEIGPDGSLYLDQGTPGSTTTTGVARIMPDGIARILTYDFTDGGYVFTPVGSDDGTVFVHATLPDGGTEVLVYGPGATTPTVYDPPGRDGLGLVAGPNGPAYLLNTNSGLDHIMLYTVGGDARDLTNVPSAVGPRVVAPDGTLYLGYGGAVDTQTTTQFQVVIVKPDGGPAQLVQLSPNPADSNGVNIRVGTDNNAYVTYRDSVTGDIVNAVVEPDGTTRTLPFDPNGDVFGPSPTFRQYDPNAFTFGPDGRTYTMTGSTADTVVIHSSADGFETESTTSISDTGFPVGPLVFGPDGTAYLTLVKDETLFGATTSVWAITPEGATKVGEVTGLPAQGVFDGPAVTVGDDGHLYLTTYTRADAVDFPTTTVVHTFSTPIEV